MILINLPHQLHFVFFNCLGGSFYFPYTYPPSADSVHYLLKSIKSNVDQRFSHIHNIKYNVNNA